MTYEIWKQREELRSRNPLAFELLSNILFTEDPMCINFEINTDEYEPEVGTILPRLRECRSAEDVRRVVYEEFVRWFGVSAGLPEKYQTIALRVWYEVVPKVTT